ncbi:MAG: SRPBCC domain-containing protein [Caulobacter sp.]|nr:SRPBCC domain-containing protein [Caulobacter sp.]
MTDRKPTAPLTVTHRFAASAERVFDAWLDPARARRFLFATPTGEIVRCDIDARVGGGFTIVDRRDGEDIEHVGRYLEIDRPRRLAFTFSVPKYDADADPEATPVVIEIRLLDDGGCELTLTHEVWAEYLEQTKGGWSKILAGLAAAL